jgi:phosphoglycerol transferase
MLLSGPVLAAWSALSAYRTRSDYERVGLALSSLLFLLAAVIGLGGFLAPRDPNNAAGFAASALIYLRNPHVFLLMSGIAAIAAVAARRRRTRIVLAIASAALGAGFTVAIGRLEDFYSFSIYYHNRSFMVLFMPVFLAALLAIWYWRAAWMGALAVPAAYPVLLVPMVFAVAGDAWGTVRWQQYVRSFCAALERDASPLERVAQLRQSGARTAWGWTHPTLSILLRERGSDAMVVNEPGAASWQPFQPQNAPSIPYAGVCQAPLVGPKRPDSYRVSTSFAEGHIPTYIQSLSGLSHPEGWAAWTEGPRLEIRFVRALPDSFDLRLRLANAFAGNREQTIKVHAGNVEREFTASEEAKEVVLAFRGVQGASTLSFDIPSPQSPQELGQGNDARKLGIALVSMSIVPRDAPKN